jgi:hypothetical protein
LSAQAAVAVATLVAVAAVVPLEFKPDCQSALR